jgi:hypothetical protein
MSKITFTGVMLIVVLAYEPFIAVAQTTEGDRAKIKEQFEKIHIDNIVEVVMKNNGGKIKGKVVSITNESFDVLSMKSDKNCPETISFDKVVSVTLVKPKKVGTKIAAGFATAFGVACLIFEVWATLGH